MVQAPPLQVAEETRPKAKKRGFRQELLWGMRAGAAAAADAVRPPDRSAGHAEACTGGIRCADHGRTGQQAVTSTINTTRKATGGLPNTHQSL